MNIINLFKKFLFNFNQISYQISSEEIDIIKKTELFKHLNEDQFKKVLNSIKLFKFQAGKLIFHLNNPPDALYIVLDGSLNVTTRLNNPIKKLYKGDYFSSVFISGNIKRSPNINITTITDTTLIKITNRLFIPIPKYDGAQQTKLEPDEVICTCMSVTRKQIQQAIDKGARTLPLISSDTGACTMCQACKYKILSMLGENPWIPAVITKVKENSFAVRSFSILPQADEYKAALPGQHIILQTIVGDQIIERAFTISDKHNTNGLLRITLKKEPKGKLTPWLFKKNFKDIKLNITNPQGSFILNLDRSITALCFASGIGITPFIAYANYLADTHSQKKIHIVYCDRDEKEFIFKEEFNEISKFVPNFSILYWNTKENGYLNEKTISDLLLKFDKPEIYICGSEAFEHFVSQTLQKLNYDSKKIHIESFVY